MCLPTGLTHRHAQRKWHRLCSSFSHQSTGVHGLLAAVTELPNHVKMLHSGAATPVSEAMGRAVLDRGAHWAPIDLDARFIRPVGRTDEVSRLRR
jgi:hypothetical protein